MYAGRSRDVPGGPHLGGCELRVSRWRRKRHGGWSQAAPPAILSLEMDEQRRRSEEAKGVALVLLSTASYAALPILGKLAYAAGVATGPLLAWRFALGGLLLALLGGGARLELRERAVLWGVGSVFALNAFSYFLALRTVPVSTAVLLVYSYPVFVTLLSAVAGLEPLTRRGVVSALLAFAGCALTARGPVHVQPAALLVLLSAFAYASYVVLSGRFARNVPSSVAAAHLAQAGAVIAIPFALYEGSLAIPPRLDAWLSVLGIAVISTVVAVQAFFAGMRRIGPARASVLSSLEVLMGTGLAIGLLGERLSLQQIAGGTLILSGVALQNLAALRHIAAASVTGGRHSRRL